mmetsp:Transcript_101264/g.261686  ORF Transcript_101264/g.261686 Transcript_101264/m.261686 type:complete len:256 (-) Transcript_101264:623-1390(-)
MSTPPIGRVRRHLFRASAPTKTTSAPTSRMTSHFRTSKEPDGSCTGSPEKMPFNIHGTPSPTRMSKTFEPKALATAMSPSPFFATAIDARASGIEVPAASGMRPMTRGGTISSCPIRAVESIIRKVAMPIQRMESVKSVHGNRSADGMVYARNTLSGSLQPHDFASCSSFSVSSPGLLTVLSRAGGLSGPSPVSAVLCGGSALAFSAGGGSVTSSEGLVGDAGASPAAHSKSRTFPLFMSCSLSTTIGLIFMYRQ